MNVEHISIAVVGSVNLDIVARVDHFPQAGETLTGARVERHPGGKGANQALAAHRLGAKVYLVACLGDDELASEALAGLRAEGVNLDYCHYLTGESTGLALILVTPGGENQIVVAPGANAAFHPRFLQVPAVDAVIAQLEVPFDTIRAAVRAKGCFLTLNAAPPKRLPTDILERVDLLVVNEFEAGLLEADLGAYGGLLAVTRGPLGAVLYRDGWEVARAAAPAVEPVDTTGAGDAFTAALTVGLVSGRDATDALDWACRAAAFSVTRRGAQGSPTAAELEEFRGN